MKSHYFFLVSLFLLTTLSNYPIFSSTKTKNLINCVRNSLNQNEESIALAPISNTTDIIYNVQKEFYELPRHEMSYNELLESKSLMQHWRFHTKKVYTCSPSYASI